jgi:hypothetical protein
VPATAAASAASTNNADNPVTELAGLKITAPPSGKMHMKVVRISPNMNPVYGLGEISWQAQDGQYQMQVQASLDLLFTSLNLYKLQSEGNLSANGIQPKRMSETRRGRSETATHFDYDANQLSFSSSNKNTELSKGAQDRATIFMQLAGLGIASPEQFQPGRQISVQVAEDRDANQFIFVVIGQEEIDTALGKIMTWHVKRPPRTGLYNSTLELWFAPAYQWYPVQIRNTETNGAVTTQTVSKISFNPLLENDMSHPFSLRLIAAVLTSAALGTTLANAGTTEHFNKMAFNLPPAASFHTPSRQSKAAFRWVVRRPSNGKSVKKYSIVTETRAMLVGKILDASSQGHISDYGLAPEKFVEKRFRKPETITSFEHDSKTCALPPQMKPTH